MFNWHYKKVNSTEKRSYAKKAEKIKVDIMKILRQIHSLFMDANTWFI